MTSVPLGFWPDNLSSLAWVMICTALVLGSIAPQYTQVVAYGVLIGFAVFVLDQLILGPLWYWWHCRG